MARRDNVGRSAVPRSYVLALLLMVYTCNFVDRQIVGILLEPIRRDLAIPDWQMGIILGLGFALLYTTVGVPLAWLADRLNRVWIVSGALAFWSIMTVLCGAAQNATQLLLARIGVGLGEAGGSPPSHSILSDLYSPEERAGALGIWALGSPLGSAVGLVCGALIAERYGWRTAFFAAGAAGVVLSLLLLATVKEPRSPLTTTMSEALKMMRWSDIAEILRKPSFVLAATGCGIASVFGYVTVFWGPTYFIRSFEASTVTVALYGAIVIVTATSAGSLIGGKLVDRLAPRWTNAYVVIPAIAMVAAAPLYWIVLTLRDPVSAALLSAVPTMLTAFWYGPVFALAQNLAGRQSRALATALLFLILNIIGLTLGPTATGVLSSYFFPAYGLAGGLRAALAVIVVAAFPAAVLLVCAGRWLAADLKAGDRIKGAHAHAN